jgi:hypothetical protein
MMMLQSNGYGVTELRVLQSNGYGVTVCYGGTRKSILGISPVCVYNGVAGEHLLCHSVTVMVLQCNGYGVTV